MHSLLEKEIRMTLSERKLLRLAVFLFAFVLVTASVTQAQFNPDSVYAKSEVMIPMRDGVRLNTSIFVPRNQQGNLPFVMLRTPYGIKSSPPFQLRGYLGDMAEEGYLFVFQDIRGRYVDNIFKAKASDYQPATQRIYRTKGFPSHINLPMATE
jgi:hypothetical protein